MRWLLLAAMLLFASSVGATDYYCDNTATGNNDGTSWTDAWTDLPAASRAIAAGDTLYISGGSSTQTYDITESLTPTSGEDGSRTTIMVGQDDGYNGIVVIDGGDTVESLIDLQSTTYGYTDYFTMDGEVDGEKHITLQNWGGAGAGEYSFAVDGYGGTITDVTIRYLSIINDDYTCDDDTCDSLAEYRAGIYFSYATDGTTLEYNYLDGCVKELVYFGNKNATGFDETFVQYNELKGYRNQDGKGGPDGIKGCGGATIRYNTIYHEEAENAYFNPSHKAEDGIQILADYVKVYGNTVYGYSQGPIRTDATDDAQNAHIYIYNNVLSQVHDGYGYQRGISLDGGSGGFSDVKIWNNTIVGFGYRGIQLSYSDATEVDVEVKNNLVVDSNIYVTYDTIADISEFVESTNLVVNSDGTQGTTSGFTLTDDPYDATDGIAFESYSAIEVTAPYNSGLETTMAAVGDDLHLTSEATMAIGAGVDLSSYFTIDAEGATRTTWDLGAYAFDGTVVDPGPETVYGFSLLFGGDKRITTGGGMTLTH